MRRTRILVVDNDEDVLISLERVLEENGYDTVTTWSVPDGMDLAASRLLVTPPSMPTALSMAYSLIRRGLGIRRLPR